MTILKYLTDTYSFEDNTIVSNFGSDEIGEYIQLQETIFYPQGGGQPSDIGIIKSENGVVFNVTKVLYNNGEVNHYGTYEGVIKLPIGTVVDLSINKEVRITNAINHTAGHILSFVVEKLYPTCKAIKGYHFNEGPYIEFENLPSNIDVLEVEKEVNQTISLQLPVLQYIEMDSVTTFEDKSKQHRIMEVEGVGSVGCGGTHINNTNQIKSFNIKKIKKGRISYFAS